MSSSLLPALLKIRKENLFFFILFLFLSFAFLTRAKAQGVVMLESKLEQSAVFDRPNFDAKILYLLPKNKKLPGTRSTVAGDDGLGLFHKVKLNSTTYGYMLDTEVDIVGSKGSKKKVY